MVPYRVFYRSPMGAMAMRSGQLQPLLFCVSQQVEERVCGNPDDWRAVRQKMRAVVGRTFGDEYCRARLGGQTAQSVLFRNMGLLSVFHLD